MTENSEGRAKIGNSYRVNDPIVNLKIRVRIVQQRSRLAELFETEEETRDTNFLESEENIFHWQEKVFSRFEAKFYADDNNCINEPQKLYHREITEKNIQGSRVYTYTDRDSYYPNESFLTRNYKSRLAWRNTSALPVPKNRKPFSERYNKKVVDNVPSYTRIRTNHYLYKECQIMYILADLTPNDRSLYDLDDSEILLCTITYDKTHKSLTVHPDFTRDEAYKISGTDMTYDYWIEHVSEQQSPEDLELAVRSTRDEALQKRQIREADIFQEFELLPDHAFRLFLSLEIASAHGFPYDALFITYHIDLPRNWNTNQTENLTGRTQRCYRRGNAANFGYIAEISMELDLSCSEDDTVVPSWPWILISVASLDNWTRYRIEGYTALALSMSPGSHHIKLYTWRPTGNMVNTLRRFFTGGTCELQDIMYCGIPSTHDDSLLEKANLETTPSGRVELKLNIIHQCRLFAEDKNFRLDNFQKLSAGSLMNSVNDVLVQFKAARDRMIRARTMNL